MLPILTTRSEAEGRPEKGSTLAKVELDLEGAPFLEPAPTEDPKADSDVHESLKADTLEGEGEKRPGGKPKKKLWLILLLLLGLLLSASVAVYLFFSRESARTSSASGEFEVVVVPSTPPEMPQAQVSKFNISWDPFWVEVTDPEGEIRFVYCKIILLTDNQRVALQVTNKKAVMRDAVYYYIRHKPYSFLANLRQLEVFKAEVLNIINYYIVPETIIPPDLPPGEAPPSGSPKERLKEILIEEYLIK